MRRPLFSKLRPRLIAAFLLVSLAPLLLLEYFNQRATRQALIDAAHRALYASATQTAQAIDGFLNENLNGLRVHALLPAVQGFLAAPGDARHKAAAWQTLLRLSRKDTVNLISFAVLDLAGHNLIDTRTVQIGRDESQRDYFKALMAAKVPAVSAMQFADAPGDSLTLHFASLVWDPAGQALGVLRMTYNATVVQQLTTQALQASPGARVVLLDEHHIRLADSARPDLIFTSVAPIQRERIRRLRAEWRLPEGGPAVATGPPALETALKRLSNGGYFTAPLSMGSQDPQAEPYAAGAARLRYRPWLVVVAEPQSVLLEGTPDIVSKVLGMYLKNSPKLVNDIEQAMQRRDSEALHFAAHTLKSSSATLGAKALAELCRQLEALGRQGGQQQDGRQVAEFRQEYEAVCKALKAEIEKRAA